MKREDKLLNNLDDFLKAVDADSPHYAGRYLYKYTDCGPWLAFTVLDEPAREDKQTAEIRKDADGKLKCLHCSYEAANFLGFRNNGERVKWSSVGAYTKRLHAFLKDQSELAEQWKHCTYRITAVRPCIGCVRVDLERTIAAKSHSINYEDYNVNTFDRSKCIGVSVGSIVEGSDVSVGPVYLNLPFTLKAFYDAVEGIDKEANFYWDRDNSHWFILECNGKYAGWAKDTLGKWTFEKDVTRKVRKALRKMVDEDGILKGNIAGCEGWTVKEDESVGCMTY